MLLIVGLISTSYASQDLREKRFVYPRECVRVSAQEVFRAHDDPTQEIKGRDGFRWKLEIRDKDVPVFSELKKMPVELVQIPAVYRDLLGSYHCVYEIRSSDGNHHSHFTLKPFGKELRGKGKED